LKRPPFGSFSVMSDEVSDESLKNSHGSSDGPLRPLKNRKDDLVVRPAIFEFTCRGYLHLEDQIKKANYDADSNLPRCRGIETRLRKIKDLSQSTRDSSVRDFLSYLSVESTKSSRNPDSTFSSNDVSSALVSDNKRLPPPQGSAPAMPVLSSSAEFGPPPDVAESHSNQQWKSSGSVQILPPPNGTDDSSGAQAPRTMEDDGDDYSTLSCLGATNVSVLMLTKSDGQREVAAVAPENTIGITVRDVGNSQEGDAVTTVRLGPMELALRNHYEVDDVDKAEDDRVDFGQELDGWERSAMPKSRRSAMAREQNSREVETDRSVANETEPSEHFSDRFVRTLVKTAISMGENATSVADIMFPIRMYKSSQRIVNEFGKTLERTRRAAKNAFTLWQDDDEDHGPR